MAFLFSAAINHLCNFGRGHYEEHFWSGTICAVLDQNSLVEGIMRYNSVNLF